MSDQDPIQKITDKVVHVYDDIQEEDNRLPNWWLFILFGTIVFAFGYWFVYHTAKVLPTPPEVYKAQLEAMLEERIRRNPTSREALVALSHNAAAVEAGRAVFVTMCAACHQATGAGNIGPNLTDRYWIHGGQPTDILKSMTEGYPEKGMPQWGRILGDEKMRNIAAFVLTLRNTNVAGKAPQGTPVD